MGEVFDRYIDTAGNYHWSDTETGHHVFKNDGSTTGQVRSETINPPKMYGWICPVCGRGMSPFTTSCPCTEKWEVTC